MEKLNESIIIDNFYDNPEYWRKYSLDQQYREVGNYKNHVVYSYFKVPHLKKATGISRIKKHSPILSNLKSIDCYLALYSKKNEAQSRENGSWIHTDKFERIGVLYLNPQEQCSGGTNFYKHKDTGVENYYQWLELTKSSPKDAEQINFDSTNLDAWEVIDRLEMVWNRLIIFDPRRFHQAPYFFGTDKSNSRLCQNFIFNSI